LQHDLELQTTSFFSGKRKKGQHMYLARLEDGNGAHNRSSVDWLFWITEQDLSDANICLNAGFDSVLAFWINTSTHFLLLLFLF
jgi:hypothetical protein